jgi:hypothetical protein
MLAWAIAVVRMAEQGSLADAHRKAFTQATSPAIAGFQMFTRLQDPSFRLDIDDGPLTDLNALPYGSAEGSAAVRVSFGAGILGLFRAEFDRRAATLGPSWTWRGGFGAAYTQRIDEAEQVQRWYAAGLDDCISHVRSPLRLETDR